MDNKKIGDFISQLRKSKNMTQKELAEKLNITDKAVSKWERGVGYPEITITPRLAELLDISVNELLLGEHITNKSENPAISSVETDSMISNVAEYVEKSNKQKVSKVNDIALTALSCVFLIAIFVCLLCNYVTRHSFDWSLYVVGSEVTVWLVIAPLFLMKKHRLVASMSGLTVAILPFLLLIEYLCPNKNWVIPFAVPIMITSLLSLWVSVVLFAYTKINRAYLISLMFILYGIIANLIINHFVQNYLAVTYENISTPIIAITSGFVAVVLAIITFLKQKKTKVN